MANDKPGYLSGLLTGLIFGGVAALLLAPKKGQELRDELTHGAEKIKERATTVGTTVGVAALDVKDHGAEILNSAKEHGAALKEEVLHHVDDVKSSVVSAATDVKTEVAEAANDAKAAVSEVKGKVQDKVADATSDTEEEADSTEGAPEKVEQV